MSVILQLPGSRTVRVIAAGPSGTAKNFLETVRGQAYLLRRISVFANYDTRVLAP